MYTCRYGCSHMYGHMYRHAHDNLAVWTILWVDDGRRRRNRPYATVNLGTAPSTRWADLVTSIAEHGQTPESSRSVVVAAAAVAGG